MPINPTLDFEFSPSQMTDLQNAFDAIFRY